MLEKTLENPLDSKEIKPVNPRGNQSWIFIGRTGAEAEAPILWSPDAKNWLIGKRPWCRERLRAGEEGDDRGWDGWMALPTGLTWVWGSYGSWWWTGKLGKLQSMGSKRVGHNWVTELNWWFPLVMISSEAKGSFFAHYESAFFFLFKYTFWINFRFTEILQR